MNSSFKEIMRSMISFVSECGDDVEIYSIVKPSKKQNLGTYGWKLISSANKKEEEFIIKIETLQYSESDLDKISFYLVDPFLLLSFLKEMVKNSIEDDIETLLKEELRFLAKIEHLKTVNR